MSTFISLGISPMYTEKLGSLGIVTPTEVQVKVIPVIMEGHNVVFQSETGTGKTFAYLLPLVQKAEAFFDTKKEIKIIAVAPTYELASQIKTAVANLTEMPTALFIGGTSISRQCEVLKKKPVIVTGNPARILELIRLKKLKTTGVTALILDEADRLLSPELRSDTEALISCLPTAVQLIACSATIPKKTENTITAILDKPGKNTELVKIRLSADEVIRKNITHWAIYAEIRDKIDMLRKFLAAQQPEKAIIFTSRPDQVDNIVTKLTYRHIDCVALHAREDKRDRKSAIDKFRNDSCRILVTSDLASRGLDINGVSFIIQMDLPQTDDAFIHRTGRTARAGATGYNVVIGDEYEMKRFAALEKRLGLTVYPKILYGGKICTPADVEMT